jgi:hypothetical protein
MTERDENGNRYISWKVWAGILAGFVMLFGGVAIASLQSNISDAHVRIIALQKEKVDKDRYDCDISRIERKLDILIERKDR